MTVHGSKGMEFPVVFVPCLNERRFPSRYKPHAIIIPDELADGIKPEGSPEELHLQEERRLMYVAMTRAKEDLHLTFCKRYGQNKTDTRPSQFLKEILSGKDGFEQKEQEHLELKTDEIFDSKEDAIKDELVKCVKRGEYQEAAKAIAALAGNSSLAVPSFDIDDYVKRLNVKCEQPITEHIGAAEYSPSKITTYEDCPRKYYYEYVLEIPGEERTYFELGTLVHSVIDKITKLLKDGKEVTEAEALGLLDTEWKASVYDFKGKEKEDRAAAEDMVKKFLVHQKGKSGKILDTEKGIGITLEGRKIRGRVDRIDVIGENLEVIDYKTGKTESRNPELKQDYQMGIYKLGVENEYKKIVTRVGHWYLRSDKESMIELSQGDIDLIKKNALETIKAIESRNFKAKSGFMECKYCDYKDLCDEYGKK
jgi:DNA helicase-2/ATP-dependent DNA helicase PcrA